MSQVGKRRDGASPLTTSRVVLAGCCLVALFAAAITWRPGGDLFAATVDDLGELLAAVAAGVFCLRAARRRDGAVARGWTLLGASCLFWAAGQALWSYYELIAGREVPFPSFADVGFLVSVPLSIVALLCFIETPARRLSRMLGLIEGGIIATGLVFLSWALVLGQLFHAQDGGVLSRVISLAYPVGDIVTVSIVVFSMTRSDTREPARLNLIGLGLVAIALSDSAFTYLTEVGSYVGSQLSDAGWVAGFLVIALAAWLGVPDAVERSRRRSARLALVAPYVPIAAAGVVAVLRMLAGRPLDSFLVWTAIAMIALLCVHQLVVLTENHALTTGLEARVRQRTAELAAREQHFSALVQRSSDVICVLDTDLRFEYVSDSVERVLGLTPDQIVGTRLVDLVKAHDVVPVTTVFARVLSEPDRNASVECAIGDDHGVVHIVELTVTNLLHDPAVHGIVVNTRDVTERKALEDRLRHDAFHDSLTGLANRAFLHQRTEHAIARSARRDTYVGIVLMDLDEFKAINDSLGHAAGDEVLVHVARRLEASVRPGDTVARLGGDEFAFLLEDLAAPEEAGTVATRILESMAAPIEVGTRELIVRASLGIAVCDDEGPADLLRNADVAMYAAKENGKDQFQLFESAMHEQVVRRLAVEADLHRALQRDEFFVHYQPTVDLASEQITGVEALVRWHHPERGLVGPNEFIPVMEATGLIVPLGVWVLEQACVQACDWHAAYPSDPPLSVNINLSARQLQDPDIVDEIANVLHDTGIEPGTVVLEITESLLMRDTEVSIARLHELKRLGVRLALDDFGTGFSSLRYLQRFPIDILKVDKSFVDPVHLGSEQSALTRAIVRIGRTLGLKVVAEGIELREQAMMLRALECDGGQGYLYSRPLPADEIEALLARTAIGERVFGRSAAAASG